MTWVIRYRNDKMLPVVRQRYSLSLYKSRITSQLELCLIAYRLIGFCDVPDFQSTNS